MRIRKILIENLRSIVSSGEIPVHNLMALVGENNAGKSNTLLAVSAFLTGGAGGLKPDDFNNQEAPVRIRITFGDLTEFERRRWRKYLAADQLILEKKFFIETDTDTGTRRVKAEYHGYEGEPAEWFLSIKGIIQRHGDRPKWVEIVASQSLPEYFLEDGKCNKSIYTKALDRYVEENEVEYGAPDLSATHALGLQSKVIASLPAFYLLPAITDYSGEIDKRQKSSTFRRLMGELSERILRNDPRFGEIEEALGRVSALLNSLSTEGAPNRLESLGSIETQIGGLLQELMPSVSSVGLSVEVEELKDIFSSGVSLTVNDGVETDVLAKGHGLQRCIVFSLLRTLIDTERVDHGQTGRGSRSIILGIEEPELYIHPQLSKLFYDVMRAFGDSDQIIYTTHSPLFVNAYNYQEVAIASKATVEQGTKIKTAPHGLFDDLEEARVFKGLSRFNASVNELFFAKKVLVVEGPEDLIAITSTLAKLGMIRNRTEEINWTVLVAGGKESIPFFQRVMNAFDITYSVLHDTDVLPNTPPQVAAGWQRTNAAIAALAGARPVHTFPHKLETTLGLTDHLKDQYRATQYFSDPANINADLEGIVTGIFA